ncbi:MAG: hypothetical protein WD992_00355 [Candidatus Levyibacteriota bacterium]
MKRVLLTLFLCLQMFASPALAISDPRLTPNNVVGINSLSPEAEIGDVTSLVNKGGDWGYVVIVIKKDEMDIGRWQSFLDQAREHHLIPIIRLATVFDKNGYWQAPDVDDARNWADFLSKLYFPTKNRYVQIYNEVNAASEWGGKVDPSGYARELAKAIDAFKEKNSDFFILNAPLDLSLPTSASSLDAFAFFQAMEDTAPGIFDKLDGWASHSYPNPGFSSPPTKSDRTGIDGFVWELDQIGQYTDKDLPVFITETGWRRATENATGLEEDQIASYYKEAFESVWNDGRVVAVAPFVLGYPEPLFDQFSFKNSKDNSEKPYFSYFTAVSDLQKVKGEPRRENLIAGLKISKPNVVLKDFENEINFKFKNVGNYVWDTKENFVMKVISANISIGHTSWSKEEIYPGQEVEASLKIKGNAEGTVPLKLQVIDGDQVLAKDESLLTIETPLSLFIKNFKSLFSKQISLGNFCPNCQK